MIPIKKLSTIHIEECQISLVLMTLLTIGTLEVSLYLSEVRTMGYCENQYILITLNNFIDYDKNLFVYKKLRLFTDS